MKPYHDIDFSQSGINGPKTITFGNVKYSQEENADVIAVYPVSFGKIQFRITPYSKLYIRIKYGGNDWGDWKQLI